MKKIHPQSKYSTSRHSSLFMRSLFLAFFIFNFSFLICYAADFGLLLGQYMEANTAGSDNAAPAPGGFEYQANILPRVSFVFNDENDLYISAGLSLNYEKKFYFVPELLRTEYSHHTNNWELIVGRMYYDDPLDFVANGLFDGARFTYNTPVGVFGLGAWYTGMLYKRNANITMTAEDQISWDTPLNYSDFGKTYFSPRRFLSSVDWEHPSLAELLRLRAAVALQVDLTSNETRYNSQYFIAKASMPFKSFLFELGGGFETAIDDGSFHIAFAWDMGAFWNLPTKFKSRLSLTGHFAGGNTGGFVAAFVPVTGTLYGSVIQTKLSAMSILGLDYTARIIDSLGASFGMSYFVRNDLGTFMAWPVNPANNTGHFLGSEFVLRVVWNPVSDIQLGLGAGVFAPGMGNVNPDEKPRLHADLTAVISIY
jgi:hypothetical protein